MSCRRTSQMRVAPVAVLVILMAIALSPGWASEGQLLSETLYSPALEGNRLGDSPTRDVTIYLPPGYAESADDRYPVLYLLHGFTGSDRLWVDQGYLGTDFRIDEIADRLILAGMLEPLLIVMPSVANRYQGSFYVNSATSGNWEDFICEDLVSYVDANYRTIPSPVSRGIAGHSMGGFGALCLGMKRPDLFGALFSMSGSTLGLVDRESSATYRASAWSSVLGLTEDSQLAGAGFIAQWQVASAAAFSPNPEAPPFYVDFPFERVDGQATPREEIWTSWASQTPLGMLDTYVENLRTLRGIGFDCGSSDFFTHIPPDNRALHQALESHDIPHFYEEFSGGHMDRTKQRFEEVVLPFFAELLDSSTSTTALPGATWGAVKQQY